MRGLTVVYFNSFYGLRSVNFGLVLFGLIIPGSDSQGRNAFVTVVYENKL